MSLLEIRNLSVQFDMGDRCVKAVDGVSLSIGQGEIVGLIGESGSGKSTLTRAAMGLLPSYARVSYDCLEIEGGVKKAAMVFQDPLTYLNPSLTVGWQLKETIFCHERQKQRKISEGEERNERPGWLGNFKEMDEQAADLLEMAGIRQVKDILGKYPFELSGGERQRIVLAIALACRPSFLIADEPTTALDATVQRQILMRLKRIAREMNMAVLLVSHDLGVIASMAERVLVMQAGTIVEEGTLRQIYEEPQSDCATKLVENARALSETKRKAKSGDCFLRVEHLSRTLAGQRTRGQILTGMSKSVKNAMGTAKQLNETLVEDVSFSVEAGECFGLAGESGCGKTTLARMLCGLVQPTAGEIYCQGEMLMPIGKGRKKEQVQQIQMLFQDPYASLNPCHTVGTILEEVLLLQGMRSRTARREKVLEMLRNVGLPEEGEKEYPAAFSGGERARIALARVLLAEPRLLILDEPVSALDKTTQHQILELLKEMQKERGLTYIFISHDLQAIRNMCDRLGVMYAGSIVETGNAREVCNEPWHPYTKMLLQSVLTPNPKKARREQGGVWLGGDVGKNVRSVGCAFACHCGYALECCWKRKPRIYHFANREVACFLYSKEHMGRQSVRAQI